MSMLLDLRGATCLPKETYGVTSLTWSVAWRKRLEIFGARLQANSALTGEICGTAWTLENLTRNKLMMISQFYRGQK
jgi:hypothetical protein